MNLPYTTTPLEVRLLWHERVEEEPSHEWLHDVLRRATDELRRGHSRSFARLPTAEPVWVD